MLKFILATLVGFSTFALADNTAINGNVQSRCIISTDTEGTFGNPNAYTLTTSTSDGGVLAVTRFDVTLADAYYAVITAPSSFSSSPSLPDTVTWTGDTTVKAVSDSTGMSAYETNKVEYGYTDKYDLIGCYNGRFEGVPWRFIYSTRSC